MTERMFGLEGRVVVLTGGAGMLGSRYVHALSRAGAHVAVADIDADAAASVAGSAPGAEAVPIPVDVTDPDSVRRLADLVLQRFGRVHALVNNAGIDPKFDPAHAAEHTHEFERIPLDAWNASLAVNLTGPFLCAQALAPRILESGGGSIVNIASIYGVVGPDQRLYATDDGEALRFKPPHYCAAKSGLLGLTRYLAAYYAGRPLRVNALVLGGVRNGHDPGFLQRYGARAPIGRMAEPGEYCGALCFLLSDAASYMTGASLVMDGGWTAW